MEIHSSSLTSIPAGYKGRNRHNQPPLTDKKEHNAESNVSSTIATNGAINEKTGIPKLQVISDRIEQQKIPSNSRAAHAVNAYIRESSQRSELISSIDLFA